jgi:hypothetical protein
MVPPQVINTQEEGGNTGIYGDLTRYNNAAGSKTSTCDYFTAGIKVTGLWKLQQENRPTKQRSGGTKGKIT